MGKSNISKYLIVFGFILIMLGFNKYGNEFLTTSILGNRLLNRVDYNLYKYSSNGSNLKVVGDYILDIDEDVNEFSYRGKIIDLNGNVIFEGVFGKNVIEGIDGKLYYYPLDLDINERYLYRLSNGLCEKVSTMPISAYLTFDKKTNKVEIEDVVVDTSNTTLYGYYLNIDNKDEIYYLENGSFNKIDVEGKYISSVPTLINNKLNYKYIIIKSRGNSKYGIYDIIGKKNIIDNNYTKLKFIKNSLFIACLNDENTNRDKCGVIDLYENTLLEFKYDDIYIDNYSSNYIIAKSNGRYDLYDASLNEIVSFVYDLRKDTNYNIRKIGDNYIIYNSYMKKDVNYNVLLLKKNGFIKEIKSNELYIYEDFVVSYDNESNEITGFDSNLVKIYSISNDVEKGNFKVTKPVIKVKDKVYDTYTGKRVSKDTTYVEIVGNGVKLYHSGDKMYLMINDEKYSLSKNDMEPSMYYISKTDNGYYYIANYLGNYTFVYLGKN